jgi:DNA-binding MarR family transcriptional regulator
MFLSRVMDEPTHTKLVEQVADQIAVLQIVTEDMDVAAAEWLGVNRTDLRCLSVLYFGGPATAARLATATRLTRGAFTTVLDRLERAGYVRRVPDETDRRRVMVELTAKVLDAIAQMWGRLAEEGVTRLREYSEEELSVIAGFLRHSIDLQIRHAARVRAALVVREARTSHSRRVGHPPD